MRLVLPLPDGWKNLAGTDATERPDAIFTIGPSVEPRLTVRYGAMVASPLDGERWVQSVLGEDVPASCQLLEDNRAPNQTVTGYPIQIIYSRIVTQSGDASGKVVEVRMTALYAMLSHNAAAVLRVRRLDESSDDTKDLLAILSRYEEPAKTLFRAASPDFQTGTCTIAALYDGLPGLWERK